MGVGLGAFGFHDVEVLRTDGGQPSPRRRTGRPAVWRIERGVVAWQISLTHTATSAGAVVVALGRRSTS